MVYSQRPCSYNSREKRFYHIWTYGNSCRKITSDGSSLFSSEVNELASNQEEADTKMFLCMKFAFTHGFESTCIVTVDSDVGILALFFSNRCDDVNVFVRVGTKSNTRILNISSSDIPTEIKEALPGLHALTGCDSTSSFYGKGKVKAFQIMRKKQEYIQVSNFTFKLLTNHFLY